MPQRRNCMKKLRSIGNLRELGHQCGVPAKAAHPEGRLLQSLHSLSNMTALSRTDSAGCMDESGGRLRKTHH